jgi:hypothetical protein
MECDGKLEEKTRHDKAHEKLQDFCSTLYLFLFLFPLSVCHLGDIAIAGNCNEYWCPSTVIIERKFFLISQFFTHFN